jgi:hypothetical protein
MLYLKLKKQKEGVAMAKWVHVIEAKKIAVLPLRPWDCDDINFSWIYIFHGSDGHIYYNFERENFESCPLKDIMIDYCEYNCQCSECPDSEFFVIVDGKKIPVKRLT